MHMIVERKKKVLGRISNFAPSGSAVRVLVARSTRIAVPAESDDTRWIGQFRSCENLDQILPNILRNCGLDWRSEIESGLKHYFQYEPGRLELWLQQFFQFERLDSETDLAPREKQKFGWIGDALLKMIDFWPMARVIDSLAISEGKSDWLDGYDIISHKDPSKGGSGAIIARLLAKSRPDLKAKFVPLPHMKEKLRPDGTRILFLEDCIMTGYECISLLRSDFKEIALSHNIDFKFATCTAYGLFRLDHYIRRGRIQNVKVIKSASGFFDNISPEGHDRAKIDQLFDDSDKLKPHGKQLLTGIDVLGKTFLSTDQRRNLDRFCRTVGRQLMFHHFQSRGDSAAQANDRASENALGFGDMGMTVAFAHGVPDNTIPLFRCAGEVSLNGKVVDWLPLFPNAVG